MREYEESNFNEDNKDITMKLNKISRKNISELINNFEPFEENNDRDEYYEYKFEHNDEEQNIETTLEGGFISKDEFKQQKNKNNNIKKSEVENEIEPAGTIRTTQDLLKLLREDLERKLPKYMEIDGIKTNLFNNGRISWNRLSYIICNYQHRIKRIKRNLRVNSHFKITLDELEEWKLNLRSTLGDNSINAVKIINNYSQSNNDLPISSKKKVLNFHPNLKIDYFNEINTKEKAYWLGFLWGELYIGKGSELCLDLGKKDEKLMDRYIKALGLNPKYKYSYTKERKSGIKKYIRIRFKSPQMANDLLNLGYKPSSFKETGFPKLNSHELDLAFLLGFFDAEGKQGTTTLHLGSKKILSQIQQKFDLPYNVYADKEGYWYLSLGGKLFNKMMNNYKNSLKRKRRLFRVPLRQSFKESITKEELYNIIWSKPIKEISKEYGVYPKLVIELCDKWKIKRPPSHYWHHQLHGKKFRNHEDNNPLV